MPRLGTLKDTIDDALKSLYIGDFSGGLNSEMDPIDLPINASPDCENVRVTKGGRVIGRDGTTVRVSSLPAANSDGAAFFYDDNGERRLVVFNNGALYDCTSYTAVLIQSACYTSGNRVAATVLNRVLYFSDGETITTVGSDDSGIWKWDPVNSPTSASILISAGTAGTIETPAAKCLTTYAGSLVLGRIKYVGGTYAKHAVMWSNVNDPTTIVGTNIFQVGQGQGGEINAVVPMAVTAVGVSPYRAIFVGKSEQGIYHLKGALTVSDLSEVLINAPTGVLDGATVQFIPGVDGAGYIVWLGTDYKVWFTSGVESGELSLPIRSELASAIQERHIIHTDPKFTSVRHFKRFQYILDIGKDENGVSTAYVYDWDLKIWTRYKRFPSGFWCEAKDTNGQAAIYCADGDDLQQADTGTTDNGTQIEPYWKTGFAHAELVDILKVWHWIYISYMTDDTDLVITATVNHGRGSSSVKTIAFDSDGSDAASLWDEAIWDTDTWEVTNHEQYPPYKRRTRLTVETTEGSKGLLNGYDVQVKIAQSSDGGHFEILGFNLLYLPRGRKRVAV